VNDEQTRVEMNMSVNRAVAIAAATDQTELRSLYGQAVSHGAANTLCTPEEELAYGTLRLLTLATLRIPDLYLYTHLLEALDEDPTIEPVPPLVTSQLGEIAAGTLRLAHRALETHARDCGHRPRGDAGAWRARRRVGASARALPDRDHSRMTRRLASGRAGLRAWARRWLMLALQLGLLPPAPEASGPAPAIHARFAVTRAAVPGGKHALSRPLRAGQRWRGEP
jgi:hypothetical protein